MPFRLSRAAAGALALLVAGVLVIVVRAVAQPGLAGTATTAPLPGPPAVGACLRIDDGPPAVVDCAAPHDLEVTAGVTADATPPSRSQCDARSADYLPPITVDDWLVPVAVETTVVPAPPGERVGGRGWQVCTVRPENHDRWSGTVRGMTLATFRSDVFGNCVDSTRGPRVPCGSPHDGELLGTAAVAYTGLDLDGTYFGVDSSAATLPDDVRADLQARCGELAARMTAAADPTYGGLLTAAVRVRTVAPTDVPGGVQVYLACLATPPPGRPLSGSVVGLGDAPLPLG